MAVVETKPFIRLRFAITYGFEVAAFLPILANWKQSNPQLCAPCAQGEHNGTAHRKDVHNFLIGHSRAFVRLGFSPAGSNWVCDGRGSGYVGHL